MKIFHTADWHIGKIVCERSMLDDQRYFLGKLIKLLQEEKADALIIAGDLYDRSVPSADAVELVDAVLTEITAGLQIPVLVIAGNHDSRQRISFAGKLLQKQKLFMVGTLGRKVQCATLTDQNGPVHFYLLPYFQPGELRPLFPDISFQSAEEAYNTLLKETVKSFVPNERNILVSHGFFATGQRDGEDAVLSSELSVGGSDFVKTDLFSYFDYVALGHLHAPQTAGIETARYSGSLLKYSVDEAEQQKRITCIETEKKGSLKISERYISPLRDLRIVRGNFSEILSVSRTDPKRLEDYIFAEITQNEPELEAMTRLRSVYPNALGLKYINRTFNGAVKGKTVETFRNQTPETIFTDFYREITGENPDSEKQKLAEEVFRSILNEERR